MWGLLSYATKNFFVFADKWIYRQIKQNKTKKKPQKPTKKYKQQTNYKCDKTNKHFKRSVIAPDDNTCLLEQNPLPTCLLYCRDRIRCYGIVLSKQVKKHKKGPDVFL